jgi:hypothetical protein
MFLEQLGQIHAYQLPVANPNLAVNQQCVDVSRVAEKQSVDWVVRSIAEKVRRRKYREVACLAGLDGTEVGQATQVSCPLQGGHFQRLLRGDGISTVNAAGQKHGHSRFIEHVSGIVRSRSIDPETDRTATGSEILDATKT